MATVLNRTVGLTAPYRKQLLTSVNTPDYSVSEWILNPDLSSVEGVPDVYWDISGDSVTAVDQATRDARDAEIAALELERRRAGAENEFDSQLVLRAVVELLLGEINRLRSQFNQTTAEVPQLTTTTFSDITRAQARASIRNKIQELQ